MKKYRHFKRKPSCATAKSALFTVSKDEWNTKEEIGNSMKNTLYVLQVPKGTSQAEGMTNSEKIEPVGLCYTTAPVNNSQV